VSYCPPAPAGKVVAHLNIVDVMTVPGSSEELVTEPQDEDVLDHLLSQVVVNTEDLLFFPVGLQSLLQLARALEVLAEWLLNLRTVSIGSPGRKDSRKSRGTHNDARDAVSGVAVLLQVLRDGDEDGGRESHVKDSVLLLSALLELFEVPVEVDEGFVLVILTGDVGADLAEALQLLLDLSRWNLDVGSDAPDVLRVVHLRPSISDDFDVLGEELVAILSPV